MDAAIKQRAVIDGAPVEFSEGETILEAARRTGHYIPTLCEFAALHHRPGTCRLCLTEVRHADGTSQIVTACETRLLPGDAVETRNARVRGMQRLQAELLFADHCEKCSACARHGDCELQQTALRVGLDVAKLSGTLNTRPPKVDNSSAGLTYTSDKCIRCLRCIEVCRQVQGIGAITFNETGSDAAIGFDNGRWADSDRCIGCGQCALVCPTGALAVKDQCERAMDFFADPAVTTVVQIAPAVRIAVSEAVGGEPGENFEGRVTAALKALGADYVMDTRWSADVTILEEGTELLERLRAQKAAGTLDRPKTMFTSCCPGWINHVEKQAPDMIPHISSTRSPQAIFGALVKYVLPEKLGIPAKNIRHISIMPCTAKKGEAQRESLLHNGMKDVDLVLTVQEFVTLLKRNGIDLKKTAPVPFDSPFMTESSGAAQLFATTGGVMEAALRTVSALAGGEKTLPAFTPVRGLESTREAVLETKEFGPVRVAVAWGMPAAKALIERVRAGNAPWHFAEVMACPGGCIGGGGTLRGVTWRQTLGERQQGVYRLDAGMPIRASHENPDVIRLYRETLGEPGSALAHELLHCEYEDRRRLRPLPTAAEIDRRVKLTVV